MLRRRAAAFASRLPIQSILLAFGLPLDAEPKFQRWFDRFGVVFFGGISTVEGLILNALWALFTHPTVLSQVLGDRAQFPRVLEETMRWLGPEQSAHRVVTRPTTLGGAELLLGDTVSCNLAAANHGPAELEILGAAQLGEEFGILERAA